MQLPTPIRAAISRLTVTDHQRQSAEQRLIARVREINRDLAWELNPRAQQLADALDTYGMETGQ
ncbi:MULTISPECIES: hypothetical protein [Nocardia]|uniref:hypothetical protein n=1 Tax=Nocardia TaxID=1817 RepID=UPI000D6946E0|nr:MULTISPECIES: hypothetical protein [Nocardia]